MTIEFGVLVGEIAVNHEMYKTYAEGGGCNRVYKIYYNLKKDRFFAVRNGGEFTTRKTMVVLKAAIQRGWGCQR